MSAIAERDGARTVWHFALTPNGADALWTPIACGGGIAFPGPQEDRAVECRDCLAHIGVRQAGAETHEKGSEGPIGTGNGPNGASTHESKSGPSDED